MEIEEDFECDIDEIYDDIDARSTGSIHSNYKEHYERSKKTLAKMYRDSSSESVQNKQEWHSSQASLVRIR